MTASSAERRDGALVLCPLTGYKEEFVKETDIAPKHHLAFVANLFLQWQPFNQDPH
jgi:hypothetical protein